MEHPAKIFHIFFAEASQGSFSPEPSSYAESLGNPTQKQGGRFLVHAGRLSLQPETTSAVKVMVAE